MSIAAVSLAALICAMFWWAREWRDNHPACRDEDIKSKGDYHGDS